MFRAIDLYEMTVHLWEGNTSGISNMCRVAVCYNECVSPLIGAKPYRSNLDAYIQRFNDVRRWSE